MVGDVVGRPGRRLLTEHLDGLKQQHQIDVTVVNGENAAGGVGINPKTATELFRAGADIITTGNHVWDQPQAIGLLRTTPQVVRPLNYPPGTPGSGIFTFDVNDKERVSVINVHGRVFMDTLFDCPFRAVEALLPELQLEHSDVNHHIVVDFHGEATSEKQAFAHCFDGQITAMIGTHTHVQTNDPTVLPGGTGFLTDVGMTGPSRGVIGVESRRVIDRFYSQMPVRFEVAKGPRMINAVLISCEVVGGRSKATALQLIQTHYE